MATYYSFILMSIFLLHNQIDIEFSRVYQPHKKTIGKKIIKCVFV